MAYVDIEYGDYSFEENPGLITWIQLYLVRFLGEHPDSPAWTNALSEEWEMNAKIEVYKYFFDDELLNEPSKKEWAVTFVDAALTKLDNMSLQEFGQYIGEDINPAVDYGRVKKILLNVKRMLAGMEPISTTTGGAEER